MKDPNQTLARIRAEMTSRLQSEMPALKNLSPTTRQTTVSLTRPDWDALKTISDQSGESVAEVAANVLSGWVADVQDEFDAASQDLPAGE